MQLVIQITDQEIIPLLLKILKKLQTVKIPSHRMHISILQIVFLKPKINKVQEMHFNLQENRILIHALLKFPVLIMQNFLLNWITSR